MANIIDPDFLSTAAADDKLVLWIGQGEYLLPDDTAALLNCEEDATMEDKVRVLRDWLAKSPGEVYRWQDEIRFANQQAAADRASRLSAASTASSSRVDLTKVTPTSTCSGAAWSYEAQVRFERDWDRYWSGLASKASYDERQALLISRLSGTARDWVLATGDKFEDFASFWEAFKVQFCPTQAPEVLQDQALDRVGQLQWSDLQCATVSDLQSRCEEFQSHAQFVGEQHAAELKVHFTRALPALLRREVLNTVRVAHDNKIDSWIRARDIALDIVRTQERYERRSVKGTTALGPIRRHSDSSAGFSPDPYTRRAGRYCNRCKTETHNTAECQRDVTCPHCNMRGHGWDRCKSNPDSRSRGRRGSNQFRGRDGGSFRGNTHRGQGSTPQQPPSSFQSQVPANQMLNPATPGLARNVSAPAGPAPRQAAAPSWVPPAAAQAAPRPWQGPGAIRSTLAARVDVAPAPGSSEQFVTVTYDMFESGSDLVPDIEPHNMGVNSVKVDCANTNSSDTASVVPLGQPPLSEDAAMWSATISAIGGLPSCIEVLVDSGCSGRGFISAGAAKRRNILVTKRTHPVRTIAFDGRPASTLIWYNTEPLVINFGENTEPVVATLLVLPSDDDTLILGWQSLQAAGAVIDCAKRSIHFVPGMEVPLLREDGASGAAEDVLVASASIASTGDEILRSVAARFPDKPFLTNLIRETPEIRVIFDELAGLSVPPAEVALYVELRLRNGAALPAVYARPFGPAVAQKLHELLLKLNAGRLHFAELRNTTLASLPSVQRQRRASLHH